MAFTRDRMNSRPPSALSFTTGTTAPTTTTTSRSHPTPHQTAPRSRSISTRIPPQAPKPPRRPTTTDSSTTIQQQSNPVFSLTTKPNLVPRASCGKSDDILAPPDAQSSPFAKAGLKVLGIGNGPYGELEGWLEWPPELYANERIIFYYLGSVDGRERSTLPDGN